MGFLTILRRSSLRWSGTAMLGLTLYYSLIWQSAPSGFGGDSAFTAARALAPLPGLIAATAAWEAGRLRVGGVWRGTSARGRYRVAGDALTGLACTVLLADLLAVGLASHHVGAWPRWEDVPLLAAMVAAQSAATAVSFGMGCALPRFVAVPLCATVFTLWTMIPATLETPWVRYLTGLPTDAATVTDSLAPAVMLAPVLVAAGLTTAVLAASAPLRLAGVRAVAAACCLVAAAMPAWALVAEAGYEMPTVPRAGAEVCSGDSPTICVPREYEESLPRLRAAAGKALPRMAAAGVDTPASLRLVSMDAELAPGTWRLRNQEPHTDLSATDLVATAPVPIQRYDDCPSLPDDQPRTSPGPATAWLRLAAGIPENTVRTWHGTSTLRQVDQVRSRSSAAQLTWLERQLRAVSSCDPRVHAEARR
ncbi:hypothetical protein ACFWFV_04475 [Streptomyces diastaticus]|uniref:DUF7224 domain-containing protein n=1 Tax=Streptomyces griseus TaxID=1911 RepID=A0A380MPQ3_STRGR|nr:hypothetical protein [Streptomyces griseus]SUO93681.1 Uncharacterised protein [Streptomyces griseus]